MESWNTWLAGPGWSALAPWLATYHLPKQRWFGGKGQGISSVSIQDAGWLPGEGGQVLLLIARVRAESGQEDDYFVPLWLRAVAPAENRFELVGPEGPLFVDDAGTIDTACRSLVSLIERNLSIPCSKGTITGFPCGRGLQGTSALLLRRGSAEQSNTSFFLGDQYVCKLLRRLPEGINPDYEVCRYLTETAGFKNVPALHGAIEYRRPGQEPRTLAMVQAFVPNKYDGWEQATRVLKEYLIAHTGPQCGFGKYRNAVELLGRRTAELHLALSSETEGSFGPEPLLGANLDPLVQKVEKAAHSWIDEMLAHGKWVAEPEKVRGSYAKNLDLLRELTHAMQEELGQRIRCHGDYHLGQVLWNDHDYYILDFEGEPTRTLAERRAKHSPLKDVAGILRSFGYAVGYVERDFIRERMHARSLGNAMLAARQWEETARNAFLQSYRDSMQGSHLVPSKDRRFQQLLSLYVLDKAFYEIDYERRHRPDWERIPTAGIGFELLRLSKVDE